MPGTLRFELAAPIPNHNDLAENPSDGQNKTMASANANATENVFTYREISGLIASRTSSCTFGETAPAAFPPTPYVTAVSTVVATSTDETAAEAAFCDNNTANNAA